MGTPWPGPAGAGRGHVGCEPVASGCRSALELGLKGRCLPVRAWRGEGEGHSRQADEAVAGECSPGSRAAPGRPRPVSSLNCLNSF